MENEKSIPFIVNESVLKTLCRPLYDTEDFESKSLETNFIDDKLSKIIDHHLAGNNKAINVVDITKECINKNSIDFAVNVGVSTFPNFIVYKGDMVKETFGKYAIQLSILYYFVSKGCNGRRFKVNFL